MGSKRALKFVYEEKSENVLVVLTRWAAYRAVDTQMCGKKIFYII